MTLAGNFATFTGFLGSLWRFGVEGPQLKAPDAGHIQARDAVDGALINLAAADPVVETDLVTLGYLLAHAIIEFTSIANAEAYNVATKVTPTGAVCFVQTTQAYYAYVPARAPAVVNQISVLSTAGNAAGGWQRIGFPNQVWLKQTSWFVDASAGNDENSGKTAILALKTVQELWWRVTAGTGVWVVPGVSVTVNVVDASAGDTMMFSCSAPDGALKWLGQVIADSTTSVTTVQLYNQATGTTPKMGNAAAVYTGKTFNIPGKTLGFQQPAGFAPSGTDAYFVTETGANPAPGDTLQFVTLPTFSHVIMSLDLGVSVQHLDLTGSVSQVQVITGCICDSTYQSFLVTGSRVALSPSAGVIDQVRFTRCLIEDTGNIFSPFVSYQGCGFYPLTGIIVGNLGAGVSSVIISTSFAIPINEPGSTGLVVLRGQTVQLATATSTSPNQLISDQPFGVTIQAGAELQLYASAFNQNNPVLFDGAVGAHTVQSPLAALPEVVCVDSSTLNALLLANGYVVNPRSGATALLVS